MGGIPRFQPAAEHSSLWAGVSSECINYHDGHDKIEDGSLLRESLCLEGRSSMCNLIGWRNLTWPSGQLEVDLLAVVLTI